MESIKFQFEPGILVKCIEMKTNTVFVGWTPEEHDEKIVLLGSNQQTKSVKNWFRLCKRFVITKLNVKNTEQTSFEHSMFVLRELNKDRV